MGLGDSTSLLFRIKGDASDAVRAFKETEGAAGGLAGGMGALVNPATIAAAAITAIATSAASAGLALFNLAKSASDYGSEIFDATEKTGLAAETISSLKFAADQAGTSLDTVVGGLARFSKTIGEAAAGSEQAQAKLKTLGVTSTDLDTALGQALTTISRYTPGVAQMTAAQAAFGKSGADLLPFIKSFDGNLPGLIAKCKELGLTIDGKTAKAADDFGDSLDTVTKQLGLVAKTIGIAVIPVFNKLFTDLSGWLQNNKSEITVWAGVIADAFRGALIAGKNLVNGLLDAKDFFGSALDGTGYQGYVDKAAERRRMSESPDVGTPYGPGGTIPKDPATLGLPGAEEKTNKPQKIGRADNQTDVNEGFRKAAADRVQIAKEGIDAVLSLENAGVQKSLALLEQRFLTERTKASEQVREIGKIQTAAIQYEIDNNKALLENTDLTDKDRLEIKRKIAILEENLVTKRIEISNDVVKAINAETESENEKAEAIKRSTEATEKQAAAEKERADAAVRAAEREAFEGGTVNGVLGGAESALGLNLPSIFGPTDEIKEQAEFMKEVYTDLANTAGQAIGSMVDGLAQLAANWIITGNFSAKAALSMLASIALSFAAQAGFAALMEVAHGMAESAKAAASYAVFDLVGGAAHTAAAGLHFAAAAAYGTVAAVAGAAGVGLAIGARAAGGGSSKSASGAVGAQTNKTERLDRNVDGQGKVYSGQKENSLVGALNAPIRLELKLNSEGVLDVMENSVRNNGRGRDLILNVSGS